MSLVMTVPIEKEAWVAYWLTPLTSDQKPNNIYMSPPQELKKSYKIPTYGWCFHRLVLNNCWCFPTPLSLVDRILLKNCQCPKKLQLQKTHSLSEIKAKTQLVSRNCIFLCNQPLHIHDVPFSHFNNLYKYISLKPQMMTNTY